MTQSELRTWIETHIGPGKWLVFLALLNEIRQQKTQKPLSAGAVGKWLHDTDRNPPAWVESYLPLIKARHEAPEATRVYTVSIALDRQEDAALRKVAKRAGVTPEQFLAVCLRVGLDEEIGE